MLNSLLLADSMLFFMLFSLCVVIWAARRCPVFWPLAIPNAALIYLWGMKVWELAQ